MHKYLILFLLYIFSTSLEGYEVSFDSSLDKTTLSLFRQVSRLEKMAETPPSTAYGLKRRAESDREAFLDILYSEGYYDARITIEYSGEFPSILVKLSIDKGVGYILEDGRRAQSEAIIQQQEAKVKELYEKGYPLAQVKDRNIVVDRTTKKVSVEYKIDSGPLAHFGEVTIIGLTNVKERTVKKNIQWKKGERFNPQKIEATEKCLKDSGLFSYVKIVYVDPDTICIHLHELKHRHIGAGITYSTDEFFGVEAFASHDTLSGLGDKLSFSAGGSRVRQEISVFYGFPYFLQNDQNLTSALKLKQQDTLGFREKEMSCLLEISRQIDPTVFASWGLQFERVISTHSDNNHNYYLVSAPFRIHTTQNASPSSFTHIEYSGHPYFGQFGKGFFFYKQELCLGIYYPLFQNSPLVLACSAKLGSITGQSLNQIPTPKRFYAGSANGLKGYRYLTVSPLKNGKPTGGCSYAIFQIEPRFKLIHCLYLVSFFEIGNVYSSPLPPLNQKIRRTLGGGLRYETPLGPLRFDVAFPLDRRQGIDPFFQIYASIGRSF